MQLIITGKDFRLSPSLKTFVAQQAAKLERFRQDILKVKFELDVDRHHQHGDNCRVEGWAYLPHRVIAAGGRASAMHVAVEKVAHTLSRRLEKDKEKRIARKRRA